MVAYEGRATAAAVLAMVAAASLAMVAACIKDLIGVRESWVLPFDL